MTTVAELEVWAGSQLPREYQHFLVRCSGTFVSACVVIYAPDEIIERNETFQVKECCPGHITIGDNGGGRAVVIALNKDPCPVHVVGHGSMDPDDFQLIASSLAEWAEAGYELSGRDREDGEEPPQFVDVYLDVVPPGGPGGLLTLKKELGLDIGIAELKEKLSHLPARLLRRVPYGKYLVRLRRVNQAAPALSLRQVDRPEHVVAERRSRK